MLVTRKRIAALALAVTAIAGAGLAPLSAAGASTPDKISNGGFEGTGGGSFAGWTGRAGGRAITTQAHSGSYAAYLYATTDQPRIFQNVTTTAKTSTLTVWYTGSVAVKNGCLDSVAQVLLDGSVYTATPPNNGCHGTTVWNKLTISGIGAGKHDLTLTTPSTAIVIDDVSLSS